MSGGFDRSVHGWFVTTRDMIGVAAMFITVVGGLTGFFLVREGNASRETANLENLASSYQQLTASVKSLENGSSRTDVALETERGVNAAQEQRLQHVEANIQTLNEKFTDVQSKLSTVVALLEGKRK